MIIMDLLEAGARNWDSIAVGLVIAMASAEKVCVVGIHVMKNVKDAWYSAFPNGEEDPKTVKIDWTDV
jgi:hypothetical protein